jgi:hypothetical protein
MATGILYVALSPSSFRSVCNDIVIAMRRNGGDEAIRCTSWDSGLYRFAGNGG